MNKVIALIMGFILLGTSFVFAQAQQAQAPTEQSQAAPIEVGNKLCPVTGRPVGQMGPVVKHMYNGKVYNLCCPMCHQTFDSDPAKYAKIAEDQLAAK